MCNTLQLIAEEEAVYSDRATEELAYQLGVPYPFALVNPTEIATTRAGRPGGEKNSFNTEEAREMARHTKGKEEVKKRKDNEEKSKARRKYGAVMNKQRNKEDKGGEKAKKKIK